MKRLLLSAIGISIFSFLIASCTTTLHTAKSDLDDEADFSEYSTYAWSDDIGLTDEERREANQPLVYNSLVNKRIKKLIGQQMIGRGYEYTNSSPDLMIRFHIVMEKKTSYREVPNPYYYWWRSDYDFIPYNYEEGTLVIDLIDHAKNQLVWQGYVSGMAADDPEDRREKIKEAVRKIFAKYPYRAESDQPIVSKL